jgi:cytochrome c-type protein NapB
MKLINKITIGLAAATMLFVGCNSTNDATPAKQAEVKPTISEEQLGLRKTSLFQEEVKPAATQYSTSYAGSGKKFARAFQDAPPMIPHDVTGLIPIKIGNNQCLGCHLPDVASGMGATPIPPSHFTNFRPQSSYAIKGENTSSEKLAHISIKKENHLVGARYNCTQCHAPQSEGELAVPNNFEPDYIDPDGAHKSRWVGDRMLEGLNTAGATK